MTTTTKAENPFSIPKRLIDVHQDEDDTTVIFRRLKHSPQKGETIALFPDLRESAGCVLSYMHVGQHGAADYAHMIRATSPMLPCEYQDLRIELEGLGYRLKIRSRRNGKREGTR